jgi:short subunit dehydrogenase-like uncharacterized protein
LQRPFEVVVYGATGFTGQLVATYLAKRYPGLRWAIAGRDRDKLAALRTRLSDLDPALCELPLLIADSRDGQALREVAEQTIALASTAGPFARYGSELVSACLDCGTHYCDITGEVQWVKRMIAAHHHTATERGVRIVHSCGYDSVPSDLGVFMLQRHAREAHGRACPEVHALSYLKAPMFSGGTFESVFQLVDEALVDPSTRDVFLDPHALEPDPTRAAGSRREPRGPAYEAAASVFSAPSMMGPCNTRMVYRTNALLDYPYGQDFSYEERMPAGKGARGALWATAMTVGMHSAQLGLAFKPVRAVMRRFLPKPGEGPSEEARLNASFSHEFYAELGEKKLRARFGAGGDPGYGETAKMLSESLLCLATDRAQLPLGGGVLTPGAAMGARLIERLRAAGITISAWTEA